MSKRQKKLSYLKDMDEIIHKVNEKMEKPKDLCEKDLKENRYSNVDEEVEEQKNEKVVIHVHAPKHEKTQERLAEGENVIIDLLKQFIKILKPKRKKKYSSSEDSSESGSYVLKKSKKKKHKKNHSFVEEEKAEKEETFQHQHPRVSIEEQKLKEDKYQLMEKSLQKAMIELNEYHRTYGLLDNLDKNISFIQSELVPDWLNNPKLLCPLFRTYDLKMQRFKEEIKQLEYHLNSFIQQNSQLTSLIGSLTKPKNESENEEQLLDQRVLIIKLKEIENVVKKLEKNKWGKFPCKVEVLRKENQKIEESILKSKNLLHVNKNCEVSK